MNFNNTFIFGAATSSYQIEGAPFEDGKVASIWDTFCNQAGKIEDGTNGMLGCDHYHRYREDISYMKQLGIQYYRFSISWPRIFTSRGEYNPSGMNFYKTLCQELIANGIKPAITLYHWDLPQWCENLGGWLNRESIQWFLEYAAKCFEELSPYCDFWITHNEPFCAAFLGYGVGCHAPGHANTVEAVLASHHMLVSHGKCVQLYRKLGLEGKIGITINLSPIYPETDSEADRFAAHHHSLGLNEFFLEPLFKGHYPEEYVQFIAETENYYFNHIIDGDMDIIMEPCDFLGINYYNRSVIKHDPSNPSPFASMPGKSTYDKTVLGWDISPNEFVELIENTRTYTNLPLYITENGSAWDDILEFDYTIHDTERIDYLKKHLSVIAQMNDKGYNISGYFAWSLMDNFEWSLGFSKRFGLIYIDYEHDMKRYCKDSFYEYQRILQKRTI